MYMKQNNFLCLLFAVIVFFASETVAINLFHSETENGKDTLLIVTEPADAKIIYEDSLIGYTPLRLIKIVSPLHVQKNGFENETIEPVVSQSFINIQLKKNGFANQTNFFKTNYFNLLLGSAAILGGVAAYLKLKADDKFDIYQSGGGSKFLDETRMYDLYSGISFGLLQINFGILVYNLLTD